MDDAAHFFDAIAPRYDRVYARDRASLQRSLARVLGELAPKSRVLDLGVGTGRELPALLDAGHEVVGLDASRAMLALAARRARPIPLFLGDLWAPLPWDDASFDAVLALYGTLSHPPRDAARVQFPHEVARLLRPGGVFLAELPTEAWLANAAASDPASIKLVAAGKASFTDPVTHAEIALSALSAAEWCALFQERFEVRVDASEAEELFLLAKRTARPTVVSTEKAGGPP